MLAIGTHLFYAAVSIAMTVWVARTLHRNGRIFLVDAFHGNEAMADSVNHLLVVGFYLVNLGFVSLFLRYGGRPEDGVGAVEYFSTKFGVVLMVLGAMHFFNMANFAKMRGKAKASEARERDEAARRAILAAPRPAPSVPTPPAAPAAA